MDLVLGFNIKDNCDYLLSLDNNVANQKLYKQFVFLLHKDYRSIENITKDDFEIIKKDELYLLSRFSEYFNVNYGDKDEYVKKALFLNVIKNSLELQGLLKYIFDIIKLNIKHLNKEISMEIVNLIILYFKANFIYGIDHFGLFLSVLLFQDLIGFEEFSIIFGPDIQMIFNKFRNEAFFQTFKIARQTKYKNDSNEIVIKGHFQNKFKIIIHDRHIDFLLQLLQSSPNYKESLYILLTVAHKLQNKYYDQLFDFLYNEKELIEYKNKNFFNLSFNFKPLEEFKEIKKEEKKEKQEGIEKEDPLEKLFSSNLTTKQTNNSEVEDNILKFFIKSLLKHNKFIFGYYKDFITSINERKIYEFGKDFAMLFKHLPLQEVFQLFQKCLKEFFFSTIKNVYKLCLINWGEDNFRGILTMERILEPEFDSILPDIYRFCFESLKVSDLEKNLPYLFYGNKEQFRVKYELIEKYYLNQLISSLDVHLIEKYLYPNFKEKCLESKIYQFKKQPEVKIQDQKNIEDNKPTPILPNYLILYIFNLYINSTENNLKSKFNILNLNHKYFESVVNFINFSSSVPITIKYTNSIKKLKSIGSSSEEGWSILKFNELSYLKVLVLKDGEYIDFKNYQVFSNLKTIDIVMENVVSFLSGGLIKRLSLIPALEKIRFTLGLSRITKDILNDFIYLADSLNKKIEFDINETFTMHDEYISLYILSSAHTNIKVTGVCTTLSSFLTNPETYSKATDTFTFEIVQLANYYNPENNTTTKMIKNNEQISSLKEIKNLHFKMKCSDVFKVLELLEHLDSLESLCFTFTNSGAHDLADNLDKVFILASNLPQLSNITIADDQGFPMGINWLNLTNNKFSSNNFKYFFK
ncbi:hypothetical protein DICPUDRAFT_147800 [Dictyostelium purpureum]|uniref:Uncharacterized protein n=1 Tax=Dictyostelium purpureum TaxID=5786 RepID=F0Z9F7_DICPU|nr:uncharacterized protein DICPUDRAFT_147800 [Dictyostelium purpureum]EGC39402.1 hypothetical protein DICPUDRAFT_147800 [Dictyostelium purpureum]|eukprot:XP_003284076.1 hypothetical protein DICPUDRAFT_147800 [Dictyostelium purpureum]